MSDFLSNLVERSLPTTAIVRPRLPSIFEAPSINGGAFFRGNENPERPAIEEDLQEPADRLWRLRSLWRTTTPASATQFVATLSNAGLSSRESAELLSASLQTRTRTDLTENQPSMTPSRAHRPTGDGAKKDEVRTALLRPQLLSENKPSPPSDASSRTRWTSGDGARKDEVAAAPLRPQLLSENKPSPSSANKPVPHGSTRNRPDELDTTRIVEMIAFKRDGHRKPAQARDVPIVSQRLPSSRFLASAQQPKKAPIPPAINVTIGRVEIRAVPPTAQQRAKPKAASVLSLEEYLRQRAGGGRQ